MRHASAADGIHIKSCAFQNNILGRLTNFSSAAAHDAANTDEMGARGNHDCLWPRFNLFAVEELYLFASLWVAISYAGCITSSQRPHFVIVVGVQRLAC